MSDCRTLLDRGIATVGELPKIEKVSFQRPSLYQISPNRINCLAAIKRHSRSAMADLFGLRLGQAMVGCDLCGDFVRCRHVSEHQCSATQNDLQIRTRTLSLS